MSSEISCIFVYGTLAPGEIAHQRIAKYIDNSKETVPARIRGFSLYIQHGLPIAVQVGGISEIQGFLIPIRIESIKDALHELDHYEGYYTSRGLKWNSIYERLTVKAFCDEHRERPIDTYLYGTTKEVEDMFLWESSHWTTSNDPLLKNAIPVLGEMFDDCPTPSENGEMAHMPEYWHNLLRLEGTYLSLCSILERLAQLRGEFDVNGQGKRIISSGIKLLSNYEPLEKAFELAKSEKEIYLQELVKNNKKEDKKSANCKAALNQWYDIRGNLAHQGKSSLRDYGILYTATSDLLRVLTNLKNILDLNYK